MYIITNDLVISGSKATDCLHKWDSNCSYWSKDEENSSIILSFSDLKLFRIKSYKLLSYPDNVFPLEWDISGSYDNKIYNVISYYNDPLCDSQYQYIYEDVGKYCHKGIHKEYSINSNFYRYYRLRQLGMNSCSPESDKCCVHCLLLGGIDINCVFYTSSCSKQIIFNHSLLFLVALYI